MYQFIKDDEFYETRKMEIPIISREEFYKKYPRYIAKTPISRLYNIPEKTKKMCKKLDIQFVEDLLDEIYNELKTENQIIKYSRETYSILEFITQCFIVLIPEISNNLNTRYIGYVELLMDILTQFRIDPYSDWICIIHKVLSMNINSFEELKYRIDFIFENINMPDFSSEITDFYYNLSCIYYRDYEYIKNRKSIICIIFDTHHYHIMKARYMLSKRFYFKVFTPMAYDLCKNYRDVYISREPYYEVFHNGF